MSDEQKMASSSGPGGGPRGMTSSGAAGRNASVRLAAGRSERAEAAELLDPANQSLADALRISFRLVQLAMVVLAGLFFFSGFQNVQEGELGIGVLLGRDQGVVEPGPRFTAPYPVGELIRVNTGAETREIADQFWPKPLNPGADPAQIDGLPKENQLDPERVGSVITADLNLAHTLWTATYRRVDAVDYVKNVADGAEEPLVLSAIQRGIVRAVAEEPIDEMLKPSGDARTLSDRARRIAQATLDEIGAGVQIELLDLKQKVAPLYLQDRFQAVLSARSEAEKARAEAESERVRMLSEVAGEAAPTILQEIERYGALVEAGRDARAAALDGAAGAEERVRSLDAEAERALATINLLLAGEAAEVDGKTVQFASEGEVRGILANAASEREATVLRARAELELFRAQAAAFAANPRLFAVEQYTRAFADLHGKPFVQSLLMPGGATSELRINEDPEIVKRIDRAQKEAQARAAQEAAQELQRAAAFRTRRGIQRDEE